MGSRITKNKSLLWPVLLTGLIFSPTVSSESAMNKRVPAEWESQEAVWLQWPGPYEKTYEEAFGKFTVVISNYQAVHILHHDERVRRQAAAAISRAGGNAEHSNITWHKVPNDSAWMRDNGPVYVIDDGEMRIQDWSFDAWGGAFGSNVPYRNDDRVPISVGDITGLAVDIIDIVHERGNLEFNGVDTVILNWSTIGDPNRNPGYTRERAQADMKKHFGVTRVVMVEGVVAGDRTRGHIDGIARFIDENTVVVPNCTENSKCRPGGNDDLVYDAAARTIEAAGFKVIRDPIAGFVSHRGLEFDANYMNWLVGNGFVITVGFGDQALDDAAKERLQSYFPGRDVYVIEMLDSWYAGGGVHCHTNDQPALALVQTY